MDEIIKAISDRCEAATPGPWKVISEGNAKDVWAADGKKRICENVHWSNEEFIANAPSDLPYLLTEHTRLTADITRLTNENAMLERDNAKLTAELAAAVVDMPHDCRRCKYLMDDGSCELLPDGDEFSPQYTEGFDPDDCEHFAWRGVQKGDVQG